MIELEWWLRFYEDEALSASQPCGFPNASCLSALKPHVQQFCILFLLRVSIICDFLGLNRQLMFSRGLLHSAKYRLDDD